MGFPGGTSGEEHACQCNRFDRWVRKIPWRRAWQARPVSLLGNPMDREAWRATVCRVARSQTRLKRLSPAQQRWNKDSAETLPLEELPWCTSVILHGSRAIFLLFFFFSIIQVTGKELSIEILTIPFHALSFLHVEEWGSTKLSSCLRSHTSVRHPHHSSLLIPQPRTFLERSTLLETSHLWK